jgi:hypothetical protein
VRPRDDSAEASSTWSMGSHRIRSRSRTRSSQYSTHECRTTTC